MFDLKKMKWEFDEKGQFTWSATNGNKCYLLDYALELKASLDKAQGENNKKEILLNSMRAYLNTIPFLSDRKKWDIKAVNLINDYFGAEGRHIESDFFELLTPIEPTDKK